MLNSDKPIIGISIGDANGIGPEVVIKTLSEPRITDFCTPIIYGSSSTLAYHRKTIEGVNPYQIRDIREMNHNRVNLINCWQETIRINLGEPSEETGRYAFISLEAMVKDAKEGLLDAIVTAPIDKHTIQSENFNFPGHTEYLTQAFGKEESLMILSSEELKIGVITGHIPLSEVAGSISSDLILKKIKTDAQQP